MDWKTTLAELRLTMTLQEIADEVGMSKGAVHDLSSGRAETVLYESGARLLNLHKRTMRNRARRKEAA